MSTSGDPQNPTEPAAAKPAPKRPASQPAASSSAAAAAEEDVYEDEEAGEELGGGGNRFLMFNAVPSWLTSMLVHIVALLVLTLIPVPNTDESVERVITVNKEVEPEEIEEFEEQKFETPDVTNDVLSEVIDPSPEVETIAEEEDFNPADDLDEAAIQVDFADYSDTTAPRSDLMSEIGSYSGTGLAGRGTGARSGLVARGGGNAASEAAVGAALKWLRRTSARTVAGTSITVGADPAS